MNWKHLLWIIPLTAFISFLGVYYMQFYNDHMLFDMAMSCIFENNMNQSYIDYLNEINNYRK